MKSEGKKTIIVTFDPIVISLTIESMEELQELWLRTDPSLSVVAMSEIAGKYSMPLFQVLCACMRDRDVNIKEK